MVVQTLINNHLKYQNNYNIVLKNLELESLSEIGTVNF